MSGTEQPALIASVNQSCSQKFTLDDASSELDIKQPALTQIDLSHFEGNSKTVKLENEEASGEGDMDIRMEVDVEANNHSSIPVEGLLYDKDGIQENLVRKLGLIDYFPEKITLQDVLLHSSKKLELFSDIPWYVLSKILMQDYRGRDDIISEAIEASHLSHESRDKMPVDYLGEFFAQFEKACPKVNDSLPNPMDVLLTVMLSSSLFLRQILCEKLFMCKLSIPLLIPPVCNQESVFLLWALRNVFLKFELPDGRICERSVVKCKFPVISCLRLGEVSRSKSHFLNEILNDQSHSTFFHRDSKNGMNRHMLSDGLLEIAWYIFDQSKSVDSLRINVAIVNLRGDGKSEKVSKSKKFLLGMSSVVLALVDLDELGNDDVQSNIEDIVARRSRLLLLISRKGTATLTEANKKCITRSAEILKKGFVDMIFDFDCNSAKNIKVLKKETVDKIKDCIGEGCKEKLENYKGLAENLGINVDENKEECLKARTQALEIVEKVHKGDMDNLKAVNLPLQCKPWIKWAKLNTEEHRREMRGTDDINMYMDKLFMQMNALRHEQLRLIQNPNIITDVFIDYLSNSVREKNLYFLKWLQLHLDEISRQILPDLQKKCRLKWNEISSHEDDNCIGLLKELHDFEEKLAEASFGLEHFMREIAQAYEAVCYIGAEVAGSVAEKINLLPRIMAELVLLGYPLEIMDGDAAHIPVKWVQSVFEQLYGLVGDKKIFVLSVLGIQSSGKSTLLNTMFGLQFSVAAGRCTRGVYAQLVPVCKEYLNTGYDYILVVDTEGLRAAELGKTKLQHDNGIATLVIGLGDVTLVNVKGENVSEMEDVLQIVIHALLKMRLVNKNLSLQPSCIFIHQNVSAADASQKLRTGQQKFMETLDNVAKAAGKLEDAPEYIRFNQLIDFDINTDIAYMSDLWQGDPPMAPVNSGYSESVSKIRQTLLTKVMPNRSLQLTAKKLSTRLTDLWNGILDQNFVFSFKNSMEIDAYNSLEKKLSDVLWSLKKKALEWLNDKRNEINNTDNDLKRHCALLKSECRRLLNKSYTEAQEILQDFFTSDDDISLLEQWRKSAFLRLQINYEDLIDRTIESVKCEIAKKKIKVHQKRDIQAYLGKMQDEAKNLAEELNSPESSDCLTEEQLEYCFSKKWNECMEKLPQIVKEKLNVEERVNDILENIFRHELPLLNKARKKRFDKIIQIHFNYAIDNYILEKRNVFPYVPMMFKSKRELALKSLNELLQDIDKYVTDSSEQIPIHEDQSHVLIDKVSSTVLEMKSFFYFLDEKNFEICLALFVCQYISCKYSRMGSIENVSAKTCELSKYGIHPVFEEVIFQKFSFDVRQVEREIKVHLAQQTCSKDFHVDVEEHIHSSNAEDLRKAEVFVRNIFDEVQSYIDKREIQCFREEYIEEIVLKITEMGKQEKDCTLTKVFRIDLAVYVCHFVIPVLAEKHEMYTEEMDQRLVYERESYGPCFEMFKSYYFKHTSEQGIANVFSEYLNKAIENAVDKDLARELAIDVRNNVSKLSCKPAFLKAVLRSLLKADDFDLFYLYLNDTNACFKLWLAHYIDSYLFSHKPNGYNRYSEIASRKIESLSSVVCEEISRPLSSISYEINGKDVLKKWIEKFCQQLICKLLLPCEDLLNLVAGYDILSLETFTDLLHKKLLDSKERLNRIFQSHKPEHQKQKHENVYTIIGEECKGCTKKCPFCYAPCYLNTVGHTEAGRQHMALEHHSQAFGRYSNNDSGKLVMENCSIEVVSDHRFKCKATNWEWYPYKKYRDIYPNWVIQGDPSVETTPYWKWFLKKYAEKLARRYQAGVPDVPASWNRITKEMAFESLNN